MNTRTVIVTGASRGIGRAICLELANEYTNIIINYSKDKAGAEETLELCRSKGAKCEIFAADVSKYDEAGKLFTYCNEVFGPLDILINNAGIARDNLLMRMNEDDFDQVIAVNLKSAFNCTKLAVNAMSRKRHGRIISISSVVGLCGNIGQANYAASKAGIIGFTKSVAKEYAKRGITVNAIAPGFIETAMTDILSEDIKTAMLSQIPAAKLGTPEDVAKTVTFLAGDNASYITGQVISVDGGMHM